MKPPCTVPLRSIVPLLLPVAKVGPFIQPLMVMLPMTEPYVVMEPPCTRPLTVTVLLFRQLETTVGPLIEPLETTPPRCTTLVEGAGYVKVAPRFPAPGSHATGWTVIMPVVGPFDTTWQMRLPPQMIWPASPQPLDCTCVAVTTGPDLVMVT